MYKILGLNKTFAIIEMLDFSLCKKMKGLGQYDVDKYLNIVALKQH